MDEKLRGKDITFIVVCLIIIAAGLWVSLTYFHRAFPEASIDFKVTRSESRQIAADFLQERALNPAGHKNASAFEFDGMAKVFLEKELGLDRAQEYFGHPVELWYWEQRWFKPLQKEEFSVKVTPEGEIIGFMHQIPEEQAGDSLSADSARGIALTYLDQVMGKDTSAIEFVSSSLNARPNRIDHVFIFKVKDFEPAPDSDYRLWVHVQGSEVGGYYEQLRVPEKWKHSYQELRSYNSTTSQVASLFLILTIVAIIAIMFARIKRRDIRWKTAIWFGIVGFALLFLNKLNSLPLYLLNYDTTASYSGFLIKNIGQIFLEAFLEGGVLIFLLTAGAETIYRERYGQFTSLSRLFSGASWRTKSFFNGILLGLTLTAFFLAYQIIFYIVAQKLGGWAPADVPYTNLLNTAIPWVTVLFIGFYPAVSEEFMSRMFSIPFLHKYLKSLFLALIIPAFIWGFAHSAYPNQPFYIRGLEVGFAGILIGVVMLKWGILPALVWHYTVDALYTALLLFRSGNWYFIATAAVATGLLVVPLLIAFIMYLRTGKFLSPEGIRNRDEAAEPLPEAEKAAEEVIAEGKPTELVYQPLTPGLRARGWILAALCILVSLIPVEKLGESAPKFELTPTMARQIADQFLAGRGVEVGDMKRAVGVDEVLEEDAGKYFLEQGGIQAFNRLTGKTFPPNLWEVRRFKPGDRDEWKVRINPASGEIFSFEHILPEEAAGDSLAPDSARALAEAFLVDRGIAMDDFILKNTSSEKRPSRLDHRFTYEATEGNSLNLNEAKYRIQLQVAGSEISSLDYRYKLPEKWQRARQSTTALKAVFRVIKIASISLFFALALVYLFLMARKGAVAWKKAALIAILPAAIAALNGVNFFTHQAFRYDVMIPPQMFNIQNLVAFILSLLFIYLMWFLGSALLLGCYPRALDFFRPAGRRAARGDTIVGIVLAVSVAVLLAFLSRVLGGLFPHWIPFKGIDVSDALAGSLPFLDMFSSALLGTLFALVIVGFGLHLWHVVLKSPVLKGLAVLLLLFALTPGPAKELGEILLSWIQTFILLVLFVFVAARYLRNNPMMYCAAAFSIMVFRKAVQLFEAGAAIYSYHGMALLAVGLIVLLVTAILPYGRAEAIDKVPSSE